MTPAAEANVPPLRVPTLGLQLLLEASLVLLSQ